MRKILLVVMLLVAQFFSMISQALAIFTPPGSPEPSRADLNEAQKVINGLKWDVSQATKGIIKLYIPNMNKNYDITVDKDNGNYVGVRAFWKNVFNNFYDNGKGKTLTFNGVYKPVGFYIFVSSKLTARVLANELYIYTPGQGVKYIPPKERKYALGDGTGNIIGWVDVNNDPINEDGTPIIKDPKPVVNYPFKDINGHWAVKDIVALKDAGFINGYPDGTFKPESTITRAEFIVMLGRILGNKYADGSIYKYESLFIDDTNHWSYQEAIKTFNYMESIDITHIFKDDFAPDQNITREDVVAVLHSILKRHNNFQYTPDAYINLSDTGSSKFPDSIVFSSKYNLVNGYPDGTFKPNNTITRAEVSAVFVRMMEKL